MSGFKRIFVFSIGIIISTSGPVDREGKRLIKTSEAEPGKWLSMEEIFDLVRSRITFMDITGDPEIQGRSEKPDVNTSSIPTALRYQQQAKAAIETIDQSRIENFIAQFSKYYNRYFSSRSGVDSQQWLLTQIQGILSGYAGASSVQEFDHKFPQKSIIAKIEGSDPDLKSQVVILGAHLDSINQIGAVFKAPGADDNAAGSSVVVESLRVFVNNNMVLKRTIEWHFYAAEEVGLRGSAGIAKDYKDKNVGVVGMLNLDVVGYEEPNRTETIAIFEDNSVPAMVKFVHLLADEYVKYKKINRSCGYACSDHASWMKHGYAALMPAETKFHPYMHTGADEVSRVSFPLVKEFTKLAVGFMVEFGEPSGAAGGVDTSTSPSQVNLWLPQN